MRLLLPALLSLLTTAAHAQDADDDLPEARETVYATETTLIMDGTDVVAGTMGPGIGLGTERPPSRFSPMLPVRHHFNAELRQSVSAIQ